MSQSPLAVCYKIIACTSDVVILICLRCCANLSTRLTTRHSRRLRRRRRRKQNTSGKDEEESKGHGEQKTMEERGIEFMGRRMEGQEDTNLFSRKERTDGEKNEKERERARAKERRVVSLSTSLSLFIFLPVLLPIQPSLLAVVCESCRTNRYKRSS